MRLLAALAATLLPLAAPLEERWLVQTRRDAPPQLIVSAAAAAAAAGAGAALHHLRELDVHLASMPANAAEALRAHADVLYVERDLPLRARYLAGATADASLPLPPPASLPPALTSVSGASLQLAAPWHLDRLDQRSLPLDSLFAEPSAAGQGVDIYVLDSGVRASHADFGGRVQLARSANFFAEDGSGPDDISDVHGHGTFVASLAAGSSYGVAKHAHIIALRIYGANATGGCKRTHASGCVCMHASCVRMHACARAHARTPSLTSAPARPPTAPRPQARCRPRSRRSTTPCASGARSTARGAASRWRA